MHATMTCRPPRVCAIDIDPRFGAGSLGKRQQACVAPTSHPCQASEIPLSSTWCESARLDKCAFSNPAVRERKPIHFASAILPEAEPEDRPPCRHTSIIRMLVSINRKSKQAKKILAGWLDVTRMLLHVSMVLIHVRAWVISALATSCCNAGCRQWADFPWLCAVPRGAL
jgi:hypothetical protein